MSNERMAQSLRLLIREAEDPGVTEKVPRRTYQSIGCRGGDLRTEPKVYVI